jgi:hypothetical protein
VRFLSPEWIDALDGAVAASHLGATLGDGQAVVIEQVVVAEPGHDGVTYQVILDRGGSSVAAGRGREPTVRFTTDRATATAVHAGTESARTAFASGRLEVDGDLDALVRHAGLLAELGEVVAPLRPSTVA